MGLSHLETDYPCDDYGPKKCPNCRLRLWCFTIKEHPLPSDSAIRSPPVVRPSDLGPAKRG